MRVLYSERRSVLIENVNRELGSLAEVLGSEAGMHVTVALPKGTRDVDVAERAARQNLWMAALSLLSRQSIPSRLRLGFWRYHTGGDSARRLQTSQPAWCKESTTMNTIGPAPSFDSIAML